MFHSTVVFCANIYHYILQLEKQILKGRSTKTA